MNNFNLSEAEKAAKSFVLNGIIEGLQQSKPCDDKLTEEDFKMPKWYDEEKYKRGQKYFLDNRAGIMSSNLYGLFSLICEPHGAKLLDRTGKSSTPKTAKQRYVETGNHMLSWYTMDMTPGSESFESLKRVRKLHLMASRSAEMNGYGRILQGAMMGTQFGFMGYALVRPHLLGIKHDNDEDREGFVHLWATVGFMLGIKDEFNMCLHSLEVVEVICRIMIRYFFVPLLQLETPIFRKLGKAFMDGMAPFIPLSNYETTYFLAKRLAGIPGYQFDVDLSKEVFQRQIFTPEEMTLFANRFQNLPGFEYRQQYIFDGRMCLLDINRSGYSKKHQEPSLSFIGVHKNKQDENCNDIINVEAYAAIMKVLELGNPEELTVTRIEDDESIQKYQTDKKFYELSKSDQRLVKINNSFMKLLDNKYMRPIIEAFVGITVYKIERYTKSLKK